MSALTPFLLPFLITVSLFVCNYVFNCIERLVSNKHERHPFVISYAAPLLLSIFVWVFWSI